MRILLINHRYFVASGAERYLFNVERELNAAGHETAPFAISSPLNEPSEWSGYFASPIGKGEEIYHDEYGKRLSVLPKALKRLFYSKEVEQDLNRLIDAFKPDIAYIMLFRRKLSVSVLHALKQRSIPIVVRISDYNFLCEEHHFLRDGQSCTQCLKGKLLPGVVHGCVRGSVLTSAINALATYYQRKRGFFDMIDRFVTTNRFLMTKMIEGGFDPQRMICIPTFADHQSFRPVAKPTRDYLLYSGRLDPSKGLETLLSAMALLRDRGAGAIYPLRIVGSPSDRAYGDLLRRMVTDLRLEGLVSFTPHVEAAELAGIVANAISVVIPSVWFENLPNSYLESMCAGVPVIASNLGSLADALDDGVDGRLFQPGDAQDLASAIERTVSDHEMIDRMHRVGRNKCLRNYSGAHHLSELIGLFRTLIAPQAKMSPQCGGAEVARSRGPTLRTATGEAISDRHVTI